MGMRNLLPMSPEAPEDEAMLLRQADEHVAYFGEFTPGHF